MTRIFAARGASWPSPSQWVRVHAPQHRGSDRREYAVMCQSRGRAPALHCLYSPLLPSFFALERTRGAFSRVLRLVDNKSPSYFFLSLSPPRKMRDASPLHSTTRYDGTRHDTTRQKSIELTMSIVVASSRRRKYYRGFHLRLFRVYGH